MINDEKFDKLVDEFKKLSLMEKKNIVNEETKKLLAFIQKVKTDVEAKETILFNREILDLNSNNVSDEDFVEAMFVYIYSIREAVSEYFNEVSKYLYKQEEF